MLHKPAFRRKMRLNHVLSHPLCWIRHAWQIGTRLVSDSALGAALAVALRLHMVAYHAFGLLSERVSDLSELVQWD